MKKILLLLTLVAGLRVATNAQDKPISFGIKAGVAISNIDYRFSSGGSLGDDAKPSFYIGAVSNIKLSNLFSVQPGLIYVNKGTKYDVNITEENGKTIRVEEGSFSLSYFEVPVNILANFSLGNGKFFVGAGPYVAYALSGSRKLVDFKEDIKFGSNEEIFRRMDFGLNSLVGYQLSNGINIHGGYGIGLYEISKSSNVKIKSNLLCVGLGFNF